MVWLHQPSIALPASIDRSGRVDLSGPVSFLHQERLGALRGGRRAAQHNRRRLPRRRSFACGNQRARGDIQFQGGDAAGFVTRHVQILTRGIHSQRTRAGAQQRRATEQAQDSRLVVNLQRRNIVRLVIGNKEVAAGEVDRDRCRPLAGLEGAARDLLQSFVLDIDGERGDVARATVRYKQELAHGIDDHCGRAGTCGRRRSAQGLEHSRRVPRESLHCVRSSVCNIDNRTVRINCDGTAVSQVIRCKLDRPTVFSGPSLYTHNPAVRQWIRAYVG